MPTRLGYIGRDNDQRRRLLRIVWLVSCAVSPLFELSVLFGVAFEFFVVFSAQVGSFDFAYF